MKKSEGLRRMKIEPDAFLICDCGERVYDQKRIFGIPVFHSVFVNNTMTDGDVDFIPMWVDEDNYIMDRARFNQGYEEA